MRPSVLTGLALALVLPLAGCLGADDNTADTASTADSLSRSATPAPNARGGASGGAGNGSASGNATAGNGTVSGNATAGNHTVSGNATAGNGTGNATGNGTGNMTRVVYDNRTGKVAGTAVPILSASIKKTEAIRIGNGTLNLTLNLTSTGDTIEIEVQPPGCDEDDCVTTLEAEDGRADLGFDDPAPGTWNVTLAVSGIGPVSADYELTVAETVPVPGNTTA